MQFVNVDQLVDLSDLEKFQKKVDERIDDDFVKRFVDVNTKIDQQELDLRKDVLQ